MKKKNGFISTTVVYTFFFVFLMMLLFVISSYASNRQLLKIVKKDVKNDISDVYLARYLINHNGESGFNISMTYHSESLANSAHDNSYRFSGGSADNYVCIGSTVVTCPADNLYRIIGIFDGKVKVVKNTSLGNLPWNNFLSNSWSDSSLITYLNEGDYWNNLGVHQNLISEENWYAGGLSYGSAVGRVNNAYNYEVGNNKPTQNPVKRHIGLMYVSDYGYAAANTYWTSNLSSYSTTAIKNNNWMSAWNETTWLLSKYIITGNPNNAFTLSSTGAVSYATITSNYAVRPTFYLKTTTRRLEGTGTYSSPYRISGQNGNGLEVTNVTNSVSTNSITLTTTAKKGTANISKYMYSKDGGVNWITVNSSSTTNTYTFTGLTAYTKYNIRVKVVDVNNNESNVYSSVINTSQVFATYIRSLYTSQGSNGIYYHTSSLANSAGDNSYRYAGANPNNYVCFGSDAAVCPNNNLYRIIGVFNNQVKLRKWSSYGWLAWSGSASNTSTIWANSTLNTSDLNGTYLNGFATTWRNKIAYTYWKVGGVSWANISSYNARTAYNYEVGSYSSSTTYYSKIALMYVSDYYYAASPTYWSYPGADPSAAFDSVTGIWTRHDYGSEEVMSNNWLNGSVVFTLTRNSDGSAIYGPFTGYISNGWGNNGSSAGGVAASIYPVFYLNSTVTVTKGSGTQTDPYRIS